MAATLCRCQYSYKKYLHNTVISLRAHTYIYRRCN